MGPAPRPRRDPARSLSRSGVLLDPFPDRQPMRAALWRVEVAHGYLQLITIESVSAPFAWTAGATIVRHQRDATQRTEAFSDLSQGSLY